MSINIVAVTPGINQLTVDFTSSGIGSVESPPLFKYSYVSDQFNFLGDGVLSSPLVIMNISALTEFYIVSSDPEIGNVFSDPSSGTPLYVGSTPVIDSVVPGVNSLIVNFHQDNTGNLPAQYYYSLDGVTLSGSGVSSSPLVISNISASTTFQIVASNVAGNVFSASSSGTPLYAGSVPVIDTVVPGVNNLTVNFHQDDLGYPSATYYYSLDGVTLLGSGVSSSPLVISDISASTTFQIVASNVVNNLFSASSSGTPLYVGSQPSVTSLNFLDPSTNTVTVEFSQTDVGNPSASYFYSSDGVNGDYSVTSPFTFEVNSATTFYIIASNTAGNIPSEPQLVNPQNNGGGGGPTNTLGSAPVIDSVVPGVNNLTVNFHQDDLGNPSPTYYYSLDEVTLLGSGVSSSPLVISDISASTTFQIVASNDAGNVFSASSSGTPLYVGSTPVIDSVLPGVNSLIVNFHQDNTGNLPAQYYYSLDGTTLLGSGVSSSPLVIPNLSASTTFQIVASNDAGNVFSASSSGTPLYAGSALVIDSVVPGANNLTVNFHQDDLGNPSATYYYSLDGVTLLGSGVSSSPLVISDISASTTFQIVASNVVDNVFSDPSSGTPLYVGSTPVIDSVLPGVNSLIVNFHQDNTGNLPAQYYYSLDGTTLLGSGVSSSPLVIPNLSASTTFQIVASNAAGNVFSASSSGTPLYAGSVPIIDSVVPGVNNLTVNFHQDDLGNPSATYYYSLDGVTLSGSSVSSSPLVISDISTLTTFQIVASNAAGNVFSASSSGTPLYVGTVPVIDSVVPGVNNLTVNFHQDNLGYPSATYYYSLDGTTLSGTGVSSSPLVIPNLSASTTFQIVALNDAGNVFSASSSGTPLYVGSAPVIDSVVPGVNNLTVNFHQDTLGNPSATYYYSLDGVTLSGSGVSSSPLVISNLSTSTTFYIVASNNAGNVFSASASVTPKEPNVPCFGENSKILCFNPEKEREEYMLIQNIRKGTLVKTLNNGYVPVNMIGKTTISNNYKDQERHKNRLYKCSKRNYPEMINEDLILTGCHSILVDEFKDEEEREKTIVVNKDIYITDDLYRLPACVDERAKIYERSGKFTIYHLALDNEDYYMNYGIYANGLLVETSSKRYMRELSNMTLL